MNRRKFLRGLVGGAVIGAVATPALAELLAPKRTIFLPPRGGWVSSELYYPDWADQIQREIAAAFGIPKRYLFGESFEYLTMYADPKVFHVLIEPIEVGMPVIGDDILFGTRIMSRL